MQRESSNYSEKSEKESKPWKYFISLKSCFQEEYLSSQIQLILIQLMKA